MLKIVWYLQQKEPLDSLVTICFKYKEWHTVHTHNKPILKIFICFVSANQLNIFPSKKTPLYIPLFSLFAVFFAHKCFSSPRMMVNKFLPGQQADISYLYIPLKSELCYNSDYDAMMPCCQSIATHTRALRALCNPWIHPHHTHFASMLRAGGGNRHKGESRQKEVENHN